MINRKSESIKLLESIQTAMKEEADSTILFHSDLYKYKKADMIKAYKISLDEDIIKAYNEALGISFIDKTIQCVNLNDKKAIEEKRKRGNYYYEVAVSSIVGPFWEDYSAKRCDNSLFWLEKDHKIKDKEQRQKYIHDFVLAYQGNKEAQSTIKSWLEPYNLNFSNTLEYLVENAKVTTVLGKAKPKDDEEDEDYDDEENETSYNLVAVYDKNKNILFSKKFEVGEEEPYLLQFDEVKEAISFAENNPAAEVAILWDGIRDGESYDVEIWNNVEGDISDSPEDEKADYDYYTAETKKLLEN